MIYFLNYVEIKISSKKCIITLALLDITGIRPQILKHADPHARCFITLALLDITGIRPQILKYADPHIRFPTRKLHNIVCRAIISTSVGFELRSSNMLTTT